MAAATDLAPVIDASHLLRDDAYRYLRAIVEERPYFGLRWASRQGAPSRHAYMRAVVEMLATTGRRQIDILEVGSWAGGSTVTWARALDALALAGRVVCVDHWRQVFDLSVNQAPVYGVMVRAVESGVIYRLFEHNVRTAGVAHRVVAMRGAAADVLPLLRDAAFDVVFIDGSHMYADVLADIRQGQRLVRDGGVLCGDDLEVQVDACDARQLHDAIAASADYITDPSGTSYHPGVTLAVHETLGAVPVWNGLWAVRRTGAGWSSPELVPQPDAIPEHLRETVSELDARVTVIDGYAILESSEGAIAIASGLTPDDVLLLPRAARSAVPLVATGRNAEEARKALELRGSGSPPSVEIPPILVASDCNGYNIIRYAGRYYGVSQALGPIDLAQVDVTSFLASRQVVVSRTQADVELMVAGVQAQELRTRLEQETTAAEQKRADARHLQIAFDETEQHPATLDAAVAQLSAMVTEQSTTIGQLSGTLAEATNLSSRLAETMRTRDERVAELERQMSTLQAVRESLRDELTHIEQLSESEGKQHEASLQGAEDKIAELNRRLVAREDEAARLKVEVDVMQRWITHLQTLIVRKPSGITRGLLAGIRWRFRGGASDK